MKKWPFKNIINKEKSTLAVSKSRLIYSLILSISGAQSSGLFSALTTNLKTLLDFKLPSFKCHRILLVLNESFFKELLITIHRVFVYLLMCIMINLMINE